MVIVLGFVFTVWSESICKPNCGGTVFGAAGLREVAARSQPNHDGAMRSAIKHVLFRGCAGRPELPSSCLPARQPESSGVDVADVTR